MAEQAYPPTPSRRARRTAAAFFFVLLCGVLSGAALAEVRVTATVEPNQAVVGDPIRYRVTVETTGSRPDDNAPQVTDWGGLTPRSGPVLSNQYMTSIVNGAQSVQNFATYEWSLAPPKAGRYLIGPTKISVEGKVYRADAVTLDVAANQPRNLPVDLQKETILSARTDDPDINRQLDGRLFLRAIVSNKTPYTREPVIITYILYRDQVPLNGFEATPYEIEGALHDELFNAQSISFQPMQHNGKQFQVAQMHRVAVTPTKPGKLTINGYGLKVSIPVRRQQQRSNDPFNDPFFSSFMDDPFFGGAVKAVVPSPPIELDVKPLPATGQPKDFKGTVGDFTVNAAADRDKLTEDDLVTLRVTVEGKGAIELADVPAFPQNPDFQLVGQSAKPLGQSATDSQKTLAPDGIGGRKIFELVMRPKHAGDIQIPAIRYPTFNPSTTRYVDLATRPIPVKVEPGKIAKNTPAANGGQQAEEGEAQPTDTHQLRYLHNVGALSAHRSSLLIESWVFWSAQLLAAGLMLGAWHRHQRLAGIDPARKRRDGAWRCFERSLRSIKQRQAASSPHELAGEMNHAARSYIADRFNMSADGLTRMDIEKLLLDHSVPETRVQRLCDLLEQCEALRYAPVSAIDGELGHWMGEIETIFKESLRE